MKRNRKRFLAGALAFLLACSTLLEPGTAARAVDIQNTKEPDSGTSGNIPQTDDKIHWLLPLLGIIVGGGCIVWMAVRKRKTKKRRHIRRRPGAKRQIKRR